ncbi:alpha/beta hydrolase [Thermocrispum municipale]|uniref:alpha/beta hydrolase n=1 Tax=Thermocrispum municipale TaxID=37926 RepID=UPI00041961C0|nr:alpha/beta hydrolase-fold protein [Thermocrispum municipale]
MPSTAGLPDPYRGWNVQITPQAGNANVLDLVFDSPLLHKRITNRVYLPTSYSSTGAPLPVMYYLHGTIASPLDNPVLGPITQHEALLDAIGPGGGARQTDIFQFETQLDRAKFLLVAPDTSYADTICETCIWIDGRQDAIPNVPPLTAETLQADSFLHKELYPLVEALFNVRTDRGGRGVMGFSMGGVAAYLQGMRHPDRYAFVGSVSGALDVVDEPGGRAIWEGLGYMRDQGYGTALTNEADWRGFNPKDLVSNLGGIDAAVLSSTGDACLPATSLLQKDCMRLSPVTNPAAAAVELVLARQYAMHSRELPSKGVNETRVQYPGVHGANNYRVYRDNIVPMANQVFARKVADPQVFDYRTTATSFSVWGYDVTTTRGKVEFLDMTGVRADGRSFQLRGSGSAEVLTPAAFQPGSKHRVVASAADGTSTTREFVADAKGRLPISTDLGSGRVTIQVD